MALINRFVGGKGGDGVHNIFNIIVGSIVQQWQFDNGLSTAEEVVETNLKFPLFKLQDRQYTNIALLCHIKVSQIQ